MFNRNKKFPKYNSDKIAWQELKKGSLEALGFFYDKYLDDLYAIGISIHPNKENIQDSIHDMFIELYKYHNSISDVENVKGYLILSLKRKLIKNIKSNEYVIDKIDLEKKLHKTGNNEDVEKKLIADEQILEDKEKVDYAILSLTEHQKTILRLKYSENKSYSEIAEKLEVSISSARTLMYRTIKDLRKKIASFTF